MREKQAVRMQGCKPLPPLNGELNREGALCRMGMEPLQMGWPRAPAPMPSQAGHHRPTSTSPVWG